MIKYEIVMHDADGYILAQYQTTYFPTAERNLSNYFCGIEPGMKITVEAKNEEE